MSIGENKEEYSDSNSKSNSSSNRESNGVILVSGSNGTLNFISPKNLQTQGLLQLTSPCVNWCITSNSWDTTGSTFAVGTDGTHESALLIVDAQTQTKQTQYQFSEFKRSAGVFDCKFLSDSVLMTAGFDATIRVWDLRLQNRSDTGGYNNKPCLVIEDPDDVPITCISVLGDRLVAAGSQYPRTRLWDMRNPSSSFLVFIKNEQSLRNEGNRQVVSVNFLNSGHVVWAAGRSIESSVV